MSHHSLHDIAVMCAIPGIAVILPSDRHQTCEMTRQLAKYDGPVYVRMGRGAVPDIYSSDTRRSKSVKPTASEKVTTLHSLLAEKW